MNKPELLSPAGGMESAIAAISAGADALYLGGKNFSARNFAQNFTDEELTTLIEYAALRNVKIYIAVNTLYKNSELPHVLAFVAQMHKEGASAFILQDPGLAYIMKNQFPQLEIHASTQMTVHSTEGVTSMAHMGFSRVVLSRELSLTEIAEINAATNIECEVFIHGALCISYSGQCLMSSLIGGRSGNRGKCAQICRTKYDLISDGQTTQKGYLLSPKDMMTLEILKDIAATGVSSLKVEGRMKSPEYVYLVTKAYRQHLDQICSGEVRLPSKETLQNLLQIFNRGGSFSTGYYNTHSGQDMMSTVTPKSTGVLVGSVVSNKSSKCKIKFDKSAFPGDGIEIWTTDGNHVGTGISKQMNPGDITEFHLKGEKGNPVYKSHDHGLISATKKEMAAAQKKCIIFGKVEAIVGKPLCLALSHNNASATTYGNTVEIAQNAPMSKEDILTQLSKTGNTPFEIEFTSITIGENIFVSKAELNKLRRDALEELEEQILAQIKKPSYTGINLSITNIQSIKDTNTIPQKLSVQLSNLTHLPTVLKSNISRIYVNFQDIIAFPPPPYSPNTEIFAILPQISRNATEAHIKSVLPQLESSHITGYLVSTYGQLNLLEHTTKHIMLNHTFNIFNSHAIQSFQGMGITLSQELNINEITTCIKQNPAASIELIAYGRQILMATHNCPIGIYKKSNTCEHPLKTHTLRDKMGMHFPIQPDCHNCIAYIQNSKILDTVPKFQSIKNTNAEYFRLIFTSENEETTLSTITRYKEALSNKKNTPPIEDATYGHFFRGVE